jgi:hypothetical protein
MMMVVCIFYFHFCDIAEVAIIHDTEFQRKKIKIFHICGYHDRTQ